MDLYNTYGIYGIRNKINGKIYVGKTQVSFGDRRDCHFSQLNGGYHGNSHLQRAWNKYGEENFEFIIIHSCDNNEGTEEVNNLEIKYIKYYSDLKLSYNMKAGGDGGQLLGGHLSEETKRKIGEKNRIHMTGRKFSQETKEKMSKSQKERYENWSDEKRQRWGKLTSEKARGYTWSDESKKKFSERQHTKPNSAKYDVDTIKEIRRLHEKENLGYTEISKMLNIPRNTVYSIATYSRWAHVV